jgi:hypothetical protein
VAFSLKGIGRFTFAAHRKFIKKSDAYVNSFFYLIFNILKSFVLSVPAQSRTFGLDK